MSAQDLATPLHLAAAGGHASTATVLLRNGAAVGAKDTVRGPCHACQLHHSARAWLWVTNSVASMVSLSYWTVFCLRAFCACAHVRDCTGRCWCVTCGGGLRSRTCRVTCFATVLAHPAAQCCKWWPRMHSHGSAGRGSRRGRQGQCMLPFVRTLACVSQCVRVRAGLRLNPCIASDCFVRRQQFGHEFRRPRDM